MMIEIPSPSLVVLIGASGSGKSTFARKHFRATEVLSSDACRGLVADNENDQSATTDAFEILRYIASKRLTAARLTVVDATNVKAEDRKGLVDLARQFHVLPVAIVFDLPAALCHERNRSRSDRAFGSHVIRQQTQHLRRSLRGLGREGFRHIAILKTQEEIDAATVERRPLWPDRRGETGPFDIIGDIHGCFDELEELLRRMGYQVEGAPAERRARHPEGRKAVFLGDLVDRGPDSPSVLRLVMSMVEAGTALCVPGNHDMKLLRKLRGKDVRITHGLAETLQQLEGEQEDFHQKVAAFLDKLVSHYVLDGGRLVVAHAGLKAELQGRASARVRDFALFGETTGETDEFGLPVRYNWAADYRGDATVVYGHTPVPSPVWVNRTICIDTGCVFGGRLTALRYPEKELVQVSARKMYYAPARPLAPLDSAGPRGPAEGPGASAEPGVTGEQAAASLLVAERPYNDLLDIKDVVGKRIVTTRVHHSVTVREENAVAALEVMSRFAVDPHWLIYLPPTMAPPETCKSGDFLEHPRETFGYFRHQGVPRVICQEKHMGSRAVVVLCRDSEVARRRFGVPAGDGVVHTRTGRPFFSEPGLETEVLDRLRGAMERSGLWGRLETDWICLDAEIMPWSAKAQELLRLQYAPTGTSGRASVSAAIDALRQSSARNDGSQAVLARFETRLENIKRYVEAYRRYCWPVERITDLKIAPFHLLATEGRTHTNREHLWHIEVLAELWGADTELLRPTQCRVIDVTDQRSEDEGVAWWEEITAGGGEGIVVKPLQWITPGRRGLVQPAVKCRGREYLRIIYGPEYTAPEHMERLRNRGVSHKRSLALREYALGLEALHRFTEGEPLYRVHECVFGVLALESEPVDPRL